MVLWCIKGGSSGEREKRILDKSTLGIGWSKLMDLSSIQRIEDLDELYKDNFPDANKRRRGNHVGQIWRFLKKMKIGDLVVVPLKTQSAIAIGTVSSDYEYRTDLGEDMKHTRRVHWIKEDIPRTAFEQDLLYSFGAFMTVCQIKRNDAEERVKAIIEGKKPPIKEEEISEEDTEEAEEIKDIETISKDQIRQYINQNFKGHDLTRLIEEVLKAQGFFTKMMGMGPDGGVDILAGSGPMGFDNPKICVQVKSSDYPIDITVMRALRGTMQDVKATQGLLVSWGGFKRSILNEVKNNFFDIRLWDSEDIINVIQNNYDKLSESIQTDLPLKKIWTLTPPDEDEE